MRDREGNLAGAARVDSIPSWSHEPSGNGRPRGMTTHDRTRLMAHSDGKHFVKHRLSTALVFLSLALGACREPGGAGRAASPPPPAAVPDVPVIPAAPPPGVPAIPTAPLEKGVVPTLPLLGAPKRHPCAPSVKGCAAGQLPWCDASERRMACCAPWQIPTAQGEACACPPGGTTSYEGRAKGCSAPPRAFEDYQRQMNLAMEVRRDAVRQCFAGSKKAPKGLVIDLELTPEGSIFFARAAAEVHASAGVQACIAQAFSAMRIDPPPDGSLGVAYPLTFE